jgi:hypothetical protein
VVVVEAIVATAEVELTSNLPDIETGVQDLEAVPLAIPI